VRKRGAIGRFRKTIVPFRCQFVGFRSDIVRYRPISCESEQTMEKQHPVPHMELPISLEIYHQLLGASFNTGLEKEAWEIGAAAIREWMVRHNPDSFAMPATAGYQWKSLFLPNGTLLRTVFNGKNFHCLVEDDRILYNEQRVSPSGFANAVGGVRRNAWKVVWILFPNTTVWKLAGTLRAKRNAPRPRPAKSQQTVGSLPPSVPSPSRPSLSQPTAQRAEPPRQLAHGGEQRREAGQTLSRDAGEDKRAVAAIPQRTGRSTDEQGGRVEWHRQPRRDRRTGPDRRHAHQNAPQQHAPQRASAQHAPRPATAQHPRGTGHHLQAPGEQRRHQQAGAQSTPPEAGLEHQRRQDQLKQGPGSTPPAPDAGHEQAQAGRGERRAVRGPGTRPSQ
jgi:hypothetical protein